MNEVHILMTLATVHFIALMSPGPDVALVVQNAAHYGRKTGFYIALGLSFGILTHSTLSITGISYLVHQQPLLFALLQIAGGGYLFYLGWHAGWATLKNWAQATSLNQMPAQLLSSRRQAFTRGYLTNLLNPKALVFFVSLMSTLIPAGMPMSGKGIALVILWGLSLFWFALLAWLLSTARFQRHISAASRYIDLLCALIFSVIGIVIWWHAWPVLFTA
ncbi:LysE family translocator [Celerinatantimonas sp. YJH-8]|uniref:LysE family translocator n=1 Tax=Celerinatantimonas sp. YJH-8 TaxID=3228714 RepID=UPI0038C073E2